MQPFCLTRVLILLIVGLVAVISMSCPKRCRCRSLKKERQIAVVCGVKGLKKINSPNQFSSGFSKQLAKRVVFINLNNNHLKRIPDLRKFVKLRKLTLSNNSITTIEENSFKKLVRLKHLDLSGNFIKHFPAGLFQKNKRLMKVLITDIKCDCTTAWFSDWLLTNGDILTTDPRCLKPLHDQYFKEIEDFGCVELNLKIIPNVKQLIFVNDSITLTCSINYNPSDTKASIQWNFKHINHKYPLETLAEVSRFNKRLKSTITIDRLDVAKHSGRWSCTYVYGNGTSSNMTARVQLEVLNSSKTYSLCPTEKLDTDKGVFLWSKTIAGETVSFVCPKGRSPLSKTTAENDIALATRTCSHTGWHRMNSAECKYEKELARILQKYLNDDRVNSSGLVNRARYMSRYIEHAHLTSVELAIIADIIDLFVERSFHYKEFIDITLAMVDTVTRTDQRELHQAERQYRFCTRIIQSLMKLASRIEVKQSLTSRLSQHTVFSGTTILTAIHVPQSSANKKIYCVIKKNRFSGACKLEVHPIKLTTKLRQSEIKTIVIDSSCTRCKNLTQGYKLGIAIFTNAILFNSIDHSTADHLISVTIVNPESTEVTSQSRPLSEKFIYERRPVYEFNGGLSLKECVIEDDIISVNCTQLTLSAFYKMPVSFYTILSWWSVVVSGDSLLVPVSSVVLVMVCLLVFAVFVAARRCLSMPRACRHSTLNYVLALSFYAVVFSLFSRQLTLNLTSRWFCVVISMVGHYASLCLFAWTAMIVFSLYSVFLDSIYGHKIKTKDDGTPIKSAVLGLYLFSYGFPTLIVGLTCSIDVQNYSPPGDTVYPQLCILQPRAYIFSMVAPVTLFTLVTMVILVILVCLLYKENKPAPPAATATTDAAATASTSTIHRENYLNNNNKMIVKMDTEYTPSKQVCGVLILVCLNLLLWMSAVLTLAPSFDSSTLATPSYRLVYEVIYCCFVALMCLFLLFFYLFLRRDVRQFCCRCGCGHHDNDAEDTPTNNLVDGLMMMNNTRESLYHKERSPTPPSCELNTNIDQLSPLKPEYVASENGKNTSNGMVFYNAKQNGVARKYYQKSRRAATRKCLTMNNKAQSDCETGDLFKPQKTLSNDFHLIRNANSPFQENTSNLEIERLLAYSQQQDHHCNLNDQSTVADVNICSTTEPVDVTDDEHCSFYGNLTPGSARKINFASVCQIKRENTPASTDD